MRSPEVATDPLLSQIELDVDGPLVAAAGGGHGLAQALRAIQLYTPNVSAIVGVADDGGSSGRLAPALGIPPPGDVRQALVALAPEASRWRELFRHRFEDGDVAGHSLGNLMLAAFAAEAGGFDEAVQEAERCLATIGHVIPAALSGMTLRAVIDGDQVEGQLNVSRARGALQSLDVHPEGVAANPRAVAALKEAEQVVLGPGSLYTSTIAAVLVPGIGEAINQSEAQLVYVSNLITQDGETLGMDGAGHISALTSIGALRHPDVIVANDGPVQAPPPHLPVRVDADEVGGTTVVHADLLDPDHDWPQHQPNRLGAVLSALAP